MGLSQNDKSTLSQPLLRKLRKSNEIVLKKSATIQKGIASFQNCCVFSVLCWNLWKTISFFLHCKQVGSQPSVLRFMVHSQNVICHCQQRPLRPDLFCSAKHETAELKIGFHIGKHSLCLDGTVHAKLLSDPCGNFLLHCLTLIGKIFGYFQMLPSLFPGHFAFWTDAFLLAGAAGTVGALIYRFLADVPCGSFDIARACLMEQPALRTGIGIRFRVIFHILSAADVCPVFLMLFLLVVRWLDVQIYLRMMMEVVVGSCQSWCPARLMSPPSSSKPLNYRLALDCSQSFFGLWK